MFKTELTPPFRALSALGAVLFFAPAAHAAVELPEGYKLVEYIQSTGTQFIDTGIAPKSTTRMVLDFAYTVKPTTQATCGWGSSGGAEAFLFGAGAKGFYSTISKDWKNTAYVMDATGEANLPLDTERHVFDVANGSQKFDGTEYGTVSTLGNTATAAQTLYLFASRVEWSPFVDYKMKAKVYSCQIYEGEVLKRDFVPCVRMSDSKPGLYDLTVLDGTGFYGNRATGADFTAGPEVGHKMTISGNPAPIGEVTPGYGIFSSDGSTSEISFSLAGEGPYYYSADGGTRGTFSSATYQFDGSAAQTVTSTSFTLDLTADIAVVWNFTDVSRRLVAEVTEFGTVTDGVASGAAVTNWVAAGDSVTLTAVPDDGARFISWAGDLPDGVDATAATLVLPADRARTVRACCRSVDEYVWTGGAVGRWDDPANWGGEVPAEGKMVSIEATDGDVTVIVDSEPAALSRLRLLTENDHAATLIVSNWTTRIYADEVKIGAGGVVKCVGAFTNNEMSNRVWLAGNTLTVEKGGAIRADAAGYAGQNGPAWKGVSTANHKPAAIGMNIYGGSYGGKQGMIESATIGQDQYLEGPKVYGSAEYPYDPGSGAGVVAQSAGGAIFLDFNGAVVINGEVSADSAKGRIMGGTGNQYHTGHGSGGGILVNCSTIAGTGTVRANSTRTSPGSDTAEKNSAGGGGGGRIAVHYDSARQTADCDIVFEAYCKVATTTPESVGQPGTVWFPDWKFVEAGKTYNARLASAVTTANIPGNLTVADKRFGFVADAPLTVNVGGNLAVSGASEIPRFAALSLDNVNLNVQGDAALTSGEIILREGSAVTVVGDFAMTSRTPTDAMYNAILYAYATPGTSADDWFTTRFTVGGAWTMATATAVYPYISDVDTNPGAPLFQAGNLTVDAGAMFDARKRGFGWTQARFINGQGPAKVARQNTRGAGHGGLGAASASNAPAQSTYDSETEPHLAGSSARGGAWYQTGGYAGGVIRIVVDNAFVLNGDLNAKGWGAGGGGCGGAGGSIWVTALTFSGSGTALATGGSSANATCKCAGGGGRIAVYTSPGGNTFFDPENPDPAKISAACGTSYNGGDGLYSQATDGTLYYSIITYAVTSSSSAEAEFGVPTLGYGQVASGSPVITLDLAGAIDIGGETYYTNATGRIAAKFVSATLTKAGGQPETITSIPATRTINDGSTIVWNFDSVKYLLEATVAEEGGLVKIDDGEAAASASKWVDKSAQATLTAVPDDEWLFAGWLGDTENLSDNLSVATYDAQAPAAVRARFRKADECVWTGGAVGRWDDPANWGGVVPAEGKKVLLEASGRDITVVLDSESAALSRFRILGEEGHTATLVVSNWTTRLSADEIQIGAGGVIKCVGAFTDNEMSNRVWLAGNTLTVEEGGAIRADAAGYAGLNGPAWIGIDKTTPHKPAGSNCNLYGGSYGGKQGMIEAGTLGQESYQAGPKVYGSAEYPYDPGSGAGFAGQPAGGAIFLDFTGAVVVNGTVSADSAQAKIMTGTKGQHHTGHGSGGGILINCSTISGTGKVTANSTRTSPGSTSEAMYSAGGGGGGRIAVHYDSAAQDAATCDVVFEAYCKVNQTGTAEPASIGEPGTVWFSDNRFVERGRVFDAIVAGGTETANIPGDYAISEHRTGFNPSIRRVNFGGNLSVGGTIAKMSEFILKGTDVTVAKNLTLTSGEITQTGGILEVLGDFTMVNADPSIVNRKPKLNAYAPAVAGHTEAYFSVTTKVDGVWTVKTNAVVYPYVDDSTCNANTGVPYFEANQLVIEEGGAFDARLRGWGWTQSRITWPSGLGHGGERNLNDGLHGASHGGLGAANAKGLTKSTHKTYGSEKKPMLPGSSAKGASTNWGGGHAGGVIRIVAEKMQLDGALNADGQAAGGGGNGGSGGSVWITAKFLSGKGAVTAKGGSSTSGECWAGGGGGRIAIYTCINKFCDPLDPDPKHVSAARGVCSIEPPADGADSTDGTVYFKQLKGGTMILVR